MSTQALFGGPSTGEWWAPSHHPRGFFFRQKETFLMTCGPQTGFLEVPDVGPKPAVQRICISQQQTQGAWITSKLSAPQNRNRRIRCIFTSQNAKSQVLLQTSQKNRQKVAAKIAAKIAAILEIAAILGAQNRNCSVSAFSKSQRFRDAKLEVNMKCQPHNQTKKQHYQQPQPDIKRKSLKRTEDLGWGPKP